MAGVKLNIWSSATKAKKILASRLKAAKEDRRNRVEQQWAANEKYVYGDHERTKSLINFMRETIPDSEEFDVVETIEINYAFRNLRYLHAQLSANPPVATPRPESPDLEDRRAASAADAVMKYFLRQLNLHEVSDLTGLSVLLYGTGVTRTGFDPYRGDVIEFDESVMTVKLEGDIYAENVDIWRIYPDPWARNQKEIRYIFEEFEFTEEQAFLRFPGKEQLLKSKGRLSAPSPAQGSTLRSAEPKDSEQEPRYKVYAYFEPGLPENGMLGRFCYCLEDGTLLTPVRGNPNRKYPTPSLEERKEYRRTGKAPKKRSPIAYLPYHFWTDIDVPNQLWGASFLQYVGPAQNLLKNLDSATLEAVKAHGTFRMVLPPGSRIQPESITNRAIDLIQLTEVGQGEPHFISPPGLPNAMPELRANYKIGIDDLAGMNESMLGQQSRETSGFAMQYAVNQGSLIRRRLFNKYVQYVESMYKALLALAIDHWDTTKFIRILGKENSFSTVELMGIDLHGGYEIITEYGTHLPLDPIARRDELLKLMPLYEKAGIDPKILVSNLKLAELEATQSVLDLARLRAQETIDMMISNKIYIPPRRYQDHGNILAYFREYVMRSDFFELEEDIKALIEKHIAEREALMKEEAAIASAPPEGMSGGGLPGGIMGGGQPGGALPPIPPMMKPTI